MALKPGTYTIRNNTTGTVLDFMSNNTRNVLGIPSSFVMGWGSHGGANQQWELTTGNAVGQWKLRNLRAVQGCHRFLAPQQADRRGIGNNTRLSGQVAAQAIQAWNFVLDPVNGGGFRILTNNDGSAANAANANLAVNIVTGEGLPDIRPDEIVHNIAGDGTPVVLQPAAQAQVWSFVPSTEPVNLRPGVYTIRNNTTETVLDFTGNNTRNFYVMGWRSHGGANQQWELTAGNAVGQWKLRNLRVVQGGHRFLAPEQSDEQGVGIDTRLSGQVAAQAIQAWNFVLDPAGWGGFKILTNNDGSATNVAEAHLAVNIVTGEGVPGILPIDIVTNINDDGPPLALQPAAQAQAWSFTLLRLL